MGLETAHLSKRRYHARGRSPMKPDGVQLAKPMRPPRFGDPRHFRSAGVVLQ